MRFRDASASGIPAIVETFDGRNALPLETRLRQALPALLRQLMSSQACTFTVFEDEDWQGPQVVSFAAGLLVRDAVIEAYLAAPRPRLVAAILASVLDGGSPLLTLDEQRVALRALDGASDRSIAESLGLSGETVRSNWRSIYRRLSSVLGVLDAQTRRPGPR